MIRIIHTLVLGLALLGGNEFAKAADPVAPQGNTPIVVPGNPRVNQPKTHARPVVLHGTENLPGMGELYFVVSDNDVVMVDATRKPVYGSGRVLGNNRITFSFGNCIYEGEMVNGAFSGTARFISGPNANHTWTFNTRVIGNL